MSEIPGEGRVVSSSLNWILLVSALMGIVFCVILVRRNQNLVAQFQQIEGSDLADETMKKGDLVPGFSGKTLEGNFLKLSFDQQQTVTLLLVISPDCSACDDEVLEWWPQLATDPRLEVLRPTMVALSGAEVLLNKYPEEFLVGRIMTSPQAGFRRAYRIDTIPTVVLVSPAGEIVWYSLGGIDEGVFEQLLLAATKFAVPDTLDPATHAAGRSGEHTHE